MFKVKQPHDDYTYVLPDNAYFWHMINFPVFYNEATKMYLFALATEFKLGDPESESKTDFLGNTGINGLWVSAYISDKLGPNIVVDGTKILKPKVGRTSLYWESDEGDLFWHTGFEDIFVPKEYRSVVYPFKTLGGNKEYKWINPADVPAVVTDYSGEVFPITTKKYYEEGYYSGVTHPNNDSITENWWLKEERIVTLYARGDLNPNDSSDGSAQNVRVKMVWDNIYRCDRVVNGVPYSLITNWSDTNRYQAYVQMFGLFNGICGTTGTINLKGYGMFGLASGKPRIAYLESVTEKNGHPVYDIINTHGGIDGKIEYNLVVGAFVLGTFGSSEGWHEMESWPVEINSSSVFVFKHNESEETMGTDITVYCVGYTIRNTKTEYISNLGSHL